MKPLKLTMQAFGSYAQKETIQFDKIGKHGLYLISGNTGSGKSTIFDAIVFALYGETSGNDRKSGMMRSTLAEETTEPFVEFEFLYKNEKYKVRRNLAYKKIPARMSKKALENGGLTDVKPDAELMMPDGAMIKKTKDVDEKVKEILGIDSDQFKQIVMIAQGEFRKILDANTRTRKEIFRKLFKTEKYEALQNRISEQLKELHRETAGCLSAVENEYKKIRLPGVRNENDEKREFEAQEALDISLEQKWNEASKNRTVPDEVVELIQQFIEIDKTEYEKMKTEIAEIDLKLQAVSKKQQIVETTKKNQYELSLLAEAMKKADEELAELENSRIEINAKSDEMLRLKDEVAVRRENLGKYDQLDAVQREVEQRRAALCKLEEEINTAQRTLDAKRIEQTVLSEECRSLGDVEIKLHELGNTQEAARRCGKRVTSFNTTHAELVHANAQNDRNRAEIHRNETEIQGLKDKKLQLLKEVESLNDCESHKAKLEQEKLRTGERMSQIKKLSDRYQQMLQSEKAWKEAESAKSEKNERINTQKALLSDLSQELERLKDIDLEINNADSQIEKTQARLESMKEYRSSVDEWNALTEAIGAKQVELRALAEKLEHTQRQNDEIQRELSALEGCELQWEQAKRALCAADEKYDRLKKLEEKSESVLHLRAEWKASEAEYGRKRDAKLAAEQHYSTLNQLLIDDKAGFLAEKLVDNEPCPVCGSIHHPKPAQKAVDAPSEERVESAKIEFERAREELENAAHRNADCKAAFESDERHLIEAVSEEIGACSSEGIKARIVAVLASQRDEIAECSKAVADAEDACSREKERRAAQAMLQSELAQCRDRCTDVKLKLSALTGNREVIRDRNESHHAKLGISADVQCIDDAIVQLENEIARFQDELALSKSKLPRKIALEQELPNERARLEKLDGEYLELLHRFSAAEAVVAENKKAIADTAVSVGLNVAVDFLEDEISKALSDLNRQLIDVEQGIVDNDMRIERRNVLKQTEIPKIEKDVDTAEELLKDQREQLVVDETNYSVSFKNLLEDAGKTLDVRVDEQNLAYVLRNAAEAVQSELNALDVAMKRERSRGSRRSEIENSLLPSLKKDIETFESGIHSSQNKKASLDADIKNSEKLRDALKMDLDCESRDAAEQKLETMSGVISRWQKSLEQVGARISDKNGEIAGLKGRASKLNEQILEAPVLNGEELNLEETKLNAFKASFDSVLEEISSRMHGNQACLKALLKLKEGMSGAAKKEALMESLNAVANGQSGNRIDLETWVQTVRFDQILHCANMRFYEMSEHQFLLKRSESALSGMAAYGLDLNVKELANDKERPASSLSGGESFMASLALALGLSDEIQASAGGIQLDSLFIDEGFGTLSDEALKKSIDTLVSLQEKSNRMIGIISHVEELKRRIENKIIVEKAHAGSRIRFEMQDDVGAM